MVKDRLEEFQLKAKRLGGDKHNVAVLKDVPEKDRYMESLIAEIEVIKEDVEKLEEDIEKVKKKHSEILSTPLRDEKMKQELEDLMSRIKTSSRSLNTRISAMAPDLRRLEMSSAEYRIRKTQHSMLLLKFAEAMEDYSKAQADYADRCKERITTQIELTGNATTVEELEQLLDMKHPAFFGTEGLYMEERQARRSLADIKEQNADLAKLESSIIELHDLFVNMLMLIDSQGEKVDRIERHVQQAKDYVDTAKEDTRKAMEYQSKARKKVIICTVVIVVVVVIIPLLIVITAFS